MSALIQTDRLQLRLIDPDRDAADMLALLNEPGFIRNIADRGVRTLAQASDYLRSWHGAQYARDGFGHYALELRQDGRFIGTAGLIKRATLPSPDIGYALLSDQHRRGHAEEACRAVIEHARKVLGLAQICAIVSADNAASVGLLRKLGLHHAGQRPAVEGGELLEYYELDLG